MIKNLISYFRRFCGSQQGSTTPMMMMMSSLLAISGSAFLSVALYHNDTMEDSVGSIQAQYIADQAVQKVMWRIEHTDPATWNYWAALNDSTVSTVLDTALNRLTIVGHYGDTSETTYVFLELEPEPVDTIESIIVYGGTITIIGDEGTITYPVDYDPDQVDAATVLDVDSYKGVSEHALFGNTILSGNLNRGLYFIDGGDVVVEDGTTLDGGILTTGSITLRGGVTINAIKAPGDTTYFPALAAMGSIYTELPDGNMDEGGGGEPVDGMMQAMGRREERMNRREERQRRREERRLEREQRREERRRERLRERQDQEEQPPVEEAPADSLGADYVPHLSVNGLVYASENIYLDESAVNGVLLGQNIHLRGAFNVSYDVEYAKPASGLQVGNDEYKARVAGWIEKARKKRDRFRERRELEHRERDRD